MIKQSRNIGLITLKTNFVQGGYYVSSGVRELAVDLGLSILYVPSKGYGPIDLEVSALIDGIIKIGLDTFVRGEIWKNGSSWKLFGAPFGYSSTDVISGQITGTFTDLIPDGSAPITYSLYGTCLKTGGSSPGTVSFNWGLGPAAQSLGGGTTSSYIKLIERTR
jgi:hypothetical protein